MIEARIDRRQAARESYEAARAEGKRASLLEQERPNVFTMNVANIMPGDRIAVELDYSELLVPEDGDLRVRLPDGRGAALHGRRRSRRRTRGWRTRTCPRATPEPYRFDIKVHLETGIAHQGAVVAVAPGRGRPTRGRSARRRARWRRRAAATATSSCATAWRATGSRRGLLLWEGDGGRDGARASSR